MPHRIKMAQHRLILSRLLVEIFRIAAPEYLADGGEHFGSVADDILLTCAVIIGQIERRPMPASKIATYCGIPRPTTVRKLQALERVGAVVRLADGAYHLPIHRLNTPEIVAAVIGITRQIKAAAALLSKMDTDAIVSNADAHEPLSMNSESRRKVKR